MNERIERVTFDAAALTDDQRDGLSCVACGQELISAVPVGMVDGGQVFACTSHVSDSDPVRSPNGVQSEPVTDVCPPWCRDHFELTHMSRDIKVGPVLVRLFANPGDAGPSVDVARDPRRAGYGRALTVAEVLDLGRALVELAESVRGE
ncbi:MAG: hypothetical protein FWJ90_03365 [Actinomadura sp.]